MGSRARRCSASGRQHGLQPHRVETFKLSRDPRSPRSSATSWACISIRPTMPWCCRVDEKSQIQALDRTGAALPLRPGIPARQTHDYKRNGTTTLFAALSLLDGQVIGECLPRHGTRSASGFSRRSTRDARRPRPASDRRQLRHAQEPAGQALARSAIRGSICTSSRRAVPG